MADRLSIDEITGYVQSCYFPCSQREVIECAEEHQAPSKVVLAREEALPLETTPHSAAVDSLR